MPHRRDKKLFSSRKARKRRDYVAGNVGPAMNYRADSKRRKLHVSNTVPTTGSAGAPEFGKRRVNKRVTRGEIDHVVPKTATRESKASFIHRSSLQPRVVSQQRGMRMRSILLVVVIIILSLVIAASVGSCTFANSVTGKMAANDSALSAALVAPDSSTDPYYTLVATDFDPGDEDYSGPDMLVLLRVDASDRKLSMVYIPADTRVILSDGSTHNISDAQSLGGNAALVTAVSELADVDVAKFVYTDRDGFSSLVDSLGGLDLYLDDEVDDPQAGDIYIPAGWQHLNGAQALVYCRCNNYLQTDEARDRNQMDVLSTLLFKVSASTGFGELSVLDTVASSIRTNYTADELRSLMSTFSDENNSTVYKTLLAGSYYTSEGKTRFIISSSQIESQMTALDNGEDPVVKKQTTAVTPADHPIIVKNGSGVTGQGAVVSQLLSTAGYPIKETTNTDTSVYSETLVIYKDDASAAIAEDIVTKLGVGRSISAGTYYQFDTEVEVIVGKDWKPLS